MELAEIGQTARVVINSVANLESLYSVLDSVRDVRLIDKGKTEKVSQTAKIRSID